MSGSDFTGIIPYTFKTAASDTTPGRVLPVPLVGPPTYDVCVCCNDSKDTAQICPECRPKLKLKYATLSAELCNTVIGDIPNTYPCIACGSLEFGVDMWLIGDAKDIDDDLVCATCKIENKPEIRAYKDMMLPWMEVVRDRKPPSPMPIVILSRLEQALSRFPFYLTTCSICGNRRLPTQLNFMDNAQVVCGVCAIVKQASVLEPLL